MILEKVKKCNNVEEIKNVINKCSLKQIKYEILSCSGENLGNKNKGKNTPIFNMDLPIIRSIYGACLCVLGNEFKPTEDTITNCNAVIGNATNNRFTYYSKEDVFLALVVKKYNNEL